MTAQEGTGYRTRQGCRRAGYLVFLTFILASSVLRAADLAFPQDLLVTAQWLQSNLQHENLRVVDLRDSESYSQAHIERAVNIPADKMFATGSRSDMIAPIDAIQSLVSEAGISNDTVVALYDDGSLVDAGRAFWVLEVYGHQRVLLLDGGLRGWQHHGLPVTNTIVPHGRADFIPSIQPQRLATKLSTRIALDNPHVEIVDARSAPEFLGLETHADKYGHIPTAINIPALQTMTKQGGANYMKPRRELEAMFGVVPREKRVITYCTIGKKAALTYFNFGRLGYDVSNYDGSWKEWGADPTLPVEMGPGQASNASHLK